MAALASYSTPSMVMMWSVLRISLISRSVVATYAAIPQRRLCSLRVPAMTLASYPAPHATAK